MSGRDELSKWDNPVRHQIGAILTGADKLRAAVHEHDLCDEWLLATRDIDVPVSDGNRWALRDDEASDAMGAAITEIVDRLNALDDAPDHVEYTTRAQNEPLFAGPQGEAQRHPARCALGRNPMGDKEIAVTTEGDQP